MKHRLVGAIVLGCLAIIFIPVLLDGDGVRPPELNVTIPPEPEEPEVTVTRPVRSILTEEGDSEDLTDLANSVEQNNASAENIAQTEFDESVPGNRGNIDSAGLPDSWVVRVGTFSDSGNADALERTLIDAGYKAYTRSETGARSEMTIVYVGPVLSRNEVLQLQGNLEKQFSDLKGSLVEKFVIDY